MITDNEIDQICIELKKWAKERKIPKASNTTAPSQTAYSYQYTVTIPNVTPSSSTFEDVAKVTRLLHRIEEIAGSLIQSNVMNLGLSLKALVTELEEILITENE
jgi:hypothetical protein